MARADDHYRRVLALASDLGMRPLVAHCHLGLGRLYRPTGKQEEAHEHLTTASTMYGERDSPSRTPSWLEVDFSGEVAA